MLLCAMCGYWAATDGDLCESCAGLQDRPRPMPAAAIVSWTMTSLTTRRLQRATALVEQVRRTHPTVPVSIAMVNLTPPTWEAIAGPEACRGCSWSWPDDGGKVRDLVAGLFQATSRLEAADR